MTDYVTYPECIPRVLSIKHCIKNIIMMYINSLWSELSNGVLMTFNVHVKVVFQLSEVSET